MIFTPLGLQGAWLITLEPDADNRGFFARLWSSQEFRERGLESTFIESSLSLNVSTGTLRGLHYQPHPHEEVKLVTCVRGSLWDVVVDLRPGSPTLGQWEAVELSSSNLSSLYVPKGLAHGFQTLEDDTLVLYNISAPFNRGASLGVAWDDPTLDIRWPGALRRTISPRDLAHPSLQVVLSSTPAEPGEADRSQT